MRVHRQFVDIRIKANSVQLTTTPPAVALLQLLVAVTHRGMDALPRTTVTTRQDSSIDTLADWLVNIIGSYVYYDIALLALRLDVEALRNQGRGCVCLPLC
jgi:hypothetical protein